MTFTDIWQKTKITTTRTVKVIMVSLKVLSKEKQLKARKSVFSGRTRRAKWITNKDYAKESKFKYKKVIEYRRKKNKTRISEILETWFG